MFESGVGESFEIMKCPYCGNEKIEKLQGKFKLEDWGVTRKMKCKVCKKKFEEHYSLKYSRTTFKIKKQKDKQND